MNFDDRTIEKLIIVVEALLVELKAYRISNGYSSSGSASFSREADEAGWEPTYRMPRREREWWEPGVPSSWESDYGMPESGVPDYGVRDSLREAELLDFMDGTTHRTRFMTELRAMQRKANEAGWRESFEGKGKNQ
jgi:hypothetical protein